LETSIPRGLFLLNKEKFYQINTVFYMEKWYNVFDTTISSIMPKYMLWYVTDELVGDMDVLE